MNNQKGKKDDGLEFCRLTTAWKLPSGTVPASQSAAHGLVSGHESNSAPGGGGQVDQKSVAKKVSPVTEKLLESLGG